MREAVSIKQALEKNGFVIHKIKGGSMLPLLDEETDLVRLEAVACKDKLKKYDVPLFVNESNGMLVLHRIIDIKKNHYITYGDNCKHYEIVPFDTVLAVATGFYIKGKFVSCDDPEYLKYVEERCSSIKKRKLYPRKRKLTPETKVLVKLFVEAVKNDGKSMNVENEISAQFNWQKLFAEAKRHNIGAMLYPCAKKAGCPEPLITAWSQIADKALRKELLFNAERSAIISEFEKAGIKYIPLKGIIIKDYYPRKGMREFTDNDMLLEEKSIPAATKIMEKRGYRSNINEDYTDCPFYKEPIFNFELHRALFAKNVPIAKYFKDPWKKAVKDNDSNYGYHMTNEDFYIHVITHFYKHYAISRGAGLKFFADFYYLQIGLIESQKADINYIKKELSKIGILEFYEKTVEMTERLFKGDETLFTSEMLLYVLSSGAYGNKSQEIANKIKNNGRVKYWISRLFPTKGYMVKVFPIIRKAPVLLPFLWIVRLVRAPFTKSGRESFTREHNISKHIDISSDKD